MLHLYLVQIIKHLIGLQYYTSDANGFYKRQLFYT